MEQLRPLLVRKRPPTTPSLRSQRTAPSRLISNQEQVNGESRGKAIGVARAC